VDRGVAGGKCAGKCASGRDHSAHACAAHACASANGDSSADANRDGADICTIALIQRLLQGMHKQQGVRRFVHLVGEDMPQGAGVRMSGVEVRSRLQSVDRQAWRVPHCPQCQVFANA